MNFKSSKPIYLQIADFCFTKILVGDWTVEERIPSVRELGMQLEVNPNTVMRAFEYMQSEEIVYSKRGMGYFVQKDAPRQIKNVNKKDFFEQILPETFNAMSLLDISIEEVVEKYNNSIKNRI